MHSSLKYRITGLTLAAVFALFSVGLPIVVASCPMMKFENSRSCIMCNEGPSSGVQVTRALDTSCCLTVFAADRNKMEFLQANKHLLEFAKLLLAVESDFVPATVISNPQSAITPNASPPRSADIPILVSSLLI
ncbi:MAG: hypothetical protein KF749_12995 [Bacteroidetes bacterium]|nr:hypothetical protein [Bacteroidota bacterium]MCW5894388.1 hypothetical protein [Bacteroidota bacterium]